MQEIFSKDEQQQGTLNKPKPQKTGNEVEAIASTKLKVEQMERLKEICDDAGMTVYEELHLHCLLRLLYAENKRDARELFPEVEEYIQAFTFDDDKAMQALGSLRRIFGMKTIGNMDGGIEHLIIVRKGGIVEVYDPHDQSGTMGAVNGSIDQALDILLCSRFSRFRRIIARIKEERRLQSTFYAICKLLTEEYAYIMHGLDDESLGYASNEYGNVPKQIRNTKQMQ